jgi:hypothetical protein
VFNMKYSWSVHNDLVKELKHIRFELSSGKQRRK